MRTGTWWGRVLLVGIALIAIGAAVLSWKAPELVRGALHTAAQRRGFRVAYEDLRVGWGPSVRMRDLVVARVAGDTVAVAESLEVRPSIGALLRGRVEPAFLRVAHARVAMARSRSADPDTLEQPEPTAAGEAKVRRAAEEMVRLLLLPARTLPSLELRDVAIRRGAAGDSAGTGVTIERLRLSPVLGGVLLTGAGVLESQRPVPFDGRLVYRRDDRLSGDARFHVPGEDGRRSWPMRVRIDGRVHQDRGRGVIEIRDPTTVSLGEMRFALRGRLERRGPAFHVAIAADSLDGERLKRSLPPPVLGPLARVGTRGSWDYRASLDLDFTQPDSVDFAADVIPHGLRLDPSRTALGLFALDQPFVAQIHLPRDRVVTRSLAPGSSSFLPLDRIDPMLARAVVTNEDGAFFRHRGFNTDAVKEAIAENIRAGAFRRGAGTITMQLARNLWLGHERTLSRKAQEVILAWVLEHLTGVGKDRLLEIYLNVIEWGPGIHGANEASQFYFGHSAERLTVDEALLLTILVPSPNKWRWRFDSNGQLRPFARAQMHFIGRAMIAKGWLDPGALPPRDQLYVTLRGPARGAFAPEEREPEERGIFWWLFHR